MNILFRVDSSNIIGSGHLYRCMNLANLYKNNNIIFISKKHNLNLNHKIKEKYTCYELDLINSDNINLNTYTWLGEPQINDVNKTIKIIKDNNLKIDWLIIDHYGINYIWEKRIKDYVKNICVIDDFTNKMHDCNILINQQIDESQIIKYKELINNDCKIYTGNDYLFFHEKYYNLKLNKNIESLKRINIFMGGADLHNITTKVIDLCNNFNNDNNLNIIFDVIIGKSNKNYIQIKEKIKKLKNFNIYYDLNFIGNILALADLAIGAPGTTSYERCITQTPSLMICLAENQKTVIQKFIDSKTSIYIGDIYSNYENQLLFNLNYLNNNPKELKIMSNNCKKFINIVENKVNNLLYI